MVTTVTQVNSLLSGGLRFLEVLKATIVHAIRIDTGSASLGFLSALVRPLSLLALFWVMIEGLGARGIAIRGNTIAFLLTGIFCFLVHTATISQVSSAIQKSRGMLFHAPASVFLYVLAQAFSTLYLQSVAAVLIITFAQVSGYGLELLRPQNLLLPYLLSWASGLGIGLILMAISRYAATAATMISTLYTRIQFFTSGKFWAANMLPISMVEYFSWNPLFHLIDQMRGAAFVNYYPKYSDLAYPLRFTLITIVIGFMLEFWLRRSYSMSRRR